MNTYELAYKLTNALGVDYEMLEQSAIMLRQQADHIATLENQLDKCSHHEAMAHQGGYEVGYERGYAAGLKAMSRT